MACDSWFLLFTVAAIEQPVVNLSNNSQPVDIAKWLADDPFLSVRIWRWLQAYYHQKLPAHFRPFSLLHWVTKTGVAASAPGVAYYIYNSISAIQAAVATAVIFGGHSIVSFLDGASKEKRRTDADAAAETVVRVGELLSYVRPKSSREASRDASVRSALGVIEVFARQVSKSMKGDISVAIALYVGGSATKMVINHRNPGNTRPMGRKFDGVGVLGHYACVAGRAPRPVHDIRAFSKVVQRSPTQTSSNYRSFLILPLVAKRQGNEQVIGFLSIDSTKPYCFYGSRARIIVVTCQPIIEHIQDLLEIRA